MRKKNIKLIILFILTIASSCVAWSTDESTVAGSTESPPALDIMLVLDNSGSMRHNDPQFLAKRVVTNFVLGLEKDARLGVVVFDKDARVAEILTEVKAPENVQRLLSTMDQIDYRGQFTDSPAGIETAIYELRTRGRADARKVIIFLTDGIVDTGDKNRDLQKERWLREDLTLEAREADIRIFGIAFTNKADFRLIQSLALKTGGDYFRAFRAEDIESVFKQIHTTITQPPPRPVAAEEPPAPEEPTEQPSVEPEQPAATEEPTEQPSVEPEQLAVPPEPAKAPPTPTEPEEPKAAEPPPEPKVPEPVSATTPTPTPKQDLPLPLLIGAAGLLLAVALGIAMLVRRRPKRTSPAQTTPAADGVESIPEARLVDIEGVVTQDPFLLNKAIVRIGRETTNDLCIPKDTISSFHASIEYRENAFYIVDRTSGNGTFVNDERIKPETSVRLNDRDEVKFDLYRFRFLLPQSGTRGKTVLRVEPRGKTVLRNEPAGANHGDPAPADDSANAVKTSSDEREMETHLKTQMCPNHPSWRATELCPVCKNAFCHQCMTERDGKPICTGCAAKGLLTL